MKKAKGELCQITGGPHMINYTSADAFVRVVRDFIKNIPSSNT